MHGQGDRAMWLNQTLLILSALSLHIGFGLIFGYLWKRTRAVGKDIYGTIFTAAFLAFIFLPSCLVILGFSELHGLVRLIMILMGFLASILVVLPRPGKAIESHKRALGKIYPAISMLILAAWNLSIFMQGGVASSAPLAISSILASFAIIQRSP